MTERGYRRAVLGVAFASAILCLPFLGYLPLFDPDEGYYPAAAAESMDAGRPLDLTLNGEPRWNKPPLAYALMQVSMAALGRNEFAVRLPSVIAGAALVAVLGLAVARAAGGRAGLPAAAVLASSLGHQVMARAAHPEMALVLGTAAAQCVLALWFAAPGGARPRWAWWAAGIAMGFGFLAKGPSALAMPLLMLLVAMLVVPREGRPSWPAAGRLFGAAVLLALALAAPWFLWMGARHEGFWGTVLGEIGAQAGKEPEGLRASPLFFVPVLAGAFLPWVGLLPGALRGLRRSDTSPAARFTLLMALAAGTAFLFWSLSPAKNPHYALVLLPPLAAVVGRGIPGTREPWHGAIRSALGVAILSVIGFLGTLVPLGGGNIWTFFAMGYPSRELASTLREEAGTGQAPVAVYRKRIPSLTFYAGRPVSRLGTPEELRRFLASDGTRYLVYRLEHIGTPETWEAVGTSGPGWRLVGEPAGWHLWQLIRLDGPASPPLRDLAPPAPGGVPPGGEPR